MLGGPGHFKLANKRGDYGYYLFNLLDGSELMFMSGKTFRRTLTAPTARLTARLDMNSDTNDRRAKTA